MDIKKLRRKRQLNVKEQNRLRDIDIDTTLRREALRVHIDWDSHDVAEFNDSLAEQRRVGGRDWK